MDNHVRQKQGNKRQAGKGESSIGNKKSTQSAKTTAKLQGTQQTSITDISSFFVFETREAPKATVKEQAGQCSARRQKITGEAAKKLPSLKGLCWNVRGLTIALHELKHLRVQHASDFVTDCTLE